MLFCKDCNNLMDYNQRLNMYICRNCGCNYIIAVSSEPATYTYHDTKEQLQKKSDKVEFILK